ncbi:hypothetical protein HOY82DRAFT_277304 [Tuber indicum]|nr:hypothetical protein HOY82DRAFT_277304 [Tuber indicum]
MLREGQDGRNKVTAGVFTFFLLFRLTVLAYHPNIIPPPFFSPSPFPSHSIPSLCISIYFSCNLILDGQYISLFLSFSFPPTFFRSQLGVFSSFPSLFPLYLYLIPLVTSDRSTYSSTSSPNSLPCYSGKGKERDHKSIVVPRLLQLGTAVNQSQSSNQSRPLPLFLVLCGENESGEKGIGKNKL